MTLPLGKRYVLRKSRSVYENRNPGKNKPKILSILKLICSSGARQEFLYRRHSVVSGRNQHGFAQGDGLKVVLAADFGFRAVFQGAQELGHGADESVGKPDFLPARLLAAAALA